MQRLLLSHNDKWVAMVYCLPKMVPAITQWITTFYPGTRFDPQASLATVHQLLPRFYMNTPMGGERLEMLLMRQLQNDPCGYALWMPGEARPRQIFASEEACRSVKRRFAEAYEGARIVPLSPAINCT